MMHQHTNTPALYSSTIPTQLGLMTGITSDFALSSNKLCSDVPNQVTALSRSVTSYWQVTTGNSIGTVCSWKVSE